MNAKRVLNFILDLVFPPTCEVCGCAVGRGESICGECLMKFKKEMFYKCPSCGLTADRCTCGVSDKTVWKTRIGGKSFLSLTFYLNIGNKGTDRVTEKMIYSFKEKKALLDFFAETEADALKRLFDLSGCDIHEWILTFPPRSEKKLNEYGYDQSEETVKRMAKLLGCDWAYTLRRIGGEEQKALNAGEREQNAEETMSMIRENIIEGGKYIIFDDIFTTGATMNAAAKYLIFGGAAEVFPVTIAKTLYTKKGH